MKAILSEMGFAFSATEYAGVYGNEKLLQLQRRFTIRTVDRTTKIPQVTKTFKIVKCPGFKIIELPRFAKDELLTPEGAMPSAKTPITDVEIQLPTHDPCGSIEYTGKSNPNQQIVVKHIVDTFKRESRGVVGVTLKLRAGQGKSFVAKDIIDRMKLKTLVVVPNTYLLEQWTGLLAQYFPTATIGTLYGTQKKDGDIIVGIINTMADLKSFEVKEKKPIPNVGKKVKYVKVSHTVNVDEDILEKVGLAIFDESQMYVSKTFRKVFKRVRARFTIGLSATPDIREDKLDRIHQMWLGPILDAETLPGFNAAQDAFESTARMIEYHASENHCKFKVREDGMIDYASIVEAIITDPNRNALLINNITKLMDDDKCVFVFSDRRSHLEHLYTLLEEHCVKNGLDGTLEMPESEKQTKLVRDLSDREGSAEKKIILYGGSKEETINKAKRISKVIFTTFAYSSTGVSITKMNALVLATPRRSNMTQIINRVFRLGSDQTIHRTIVDIIDAKLPLKGQLRERIKAYRLRGCKLVKMKSE